MDRMEDDMSTEALSRIEKKLTKIAKQQDQICERLAGLEKARADAGAPVQKVIEFLDQFRAGEALGEASLGAWIAVSDTECLRGGLRTIAQREGMHARLLEQRLKELGGSPKFEIPEKIHNAAMESVGSTDKTDLDKLKEFVARFGDVDAQLKPLHDFAAKLDDDPETQALLQTICQDERSTLEWLNAACAQLSG